MEQIDSFYEKLMEGYPKDKLKVWNRLRAMMPTWDELHERYEKEKSLIENQVSVQEKPVTYSADSRTESISSIPVMDPRSKNSTICRQNPIKTDVFRKDMMAVSILIKDTEDIIRRLAEEQEKIKESSSKYSKARQQLSINNKKQHEKTR